MTRKIGVNFIGTEDWENYQLPAFRAMNPSVAKVNLFYDGNSTPFFGSGHLDDLLASGIEDLIIRTAETGIGERYLGHYLETPLPDTGVSVLNYIASRPQSNFWIEVGNEPDQAGVNPWVQRYWLVDVGRFYIPTMRLLYPNLRWIASLSTDKGGAGFSGADYFNVLMSDQGEGSISSLYDALGVHAYGYNSLFKGDGNHPWAVADWVHGSCSTPMWVTEAGINSSSPWESKGQLIGRALAQPELSEHNILGMTAFTFSRNPQWRSETKYGIDVDESGNVDLGFAGARAIGAGLRG